MRIIVNSVRYWHPGSHHHALVIRFYFQNSAELANALLHSRYTNSKRLDAARPRRDELGHPPTVVSNLQDDLLFFLFQPDLGRTAAGVASDVRETLLDDTE